MPMDEPLVAVSGLAKSFDGRVVVSGVTLRLGVGEVVGLVGANGGGKTTTLRMLAGLVRPDRGDGMVLGRPVGTVGISVRQRIGYMGQRQSLYPELTVVETLRFHAAVHGLPFAGTAVAQAIDRYGISAVARERCGTLSGGWARRVQFAATVLAVPALLLLDEPTAGLDVATRHDIWGWIADLARAGCGIAISTHDLVEAQRCPSVVLYHGGTAYPQAAPAVLAKEHGAPTLEAAVLSIARSGTA